MAEIIKMDSEKLIFPFGYSNKIAEERIFIQTRWRYHPTEPTTADAYSMLWTIWEQQIFIIE